MSAGLLVTRELRPVYLGHGVVGRGGGVEELGNLNSSILIILLTRYSLRLLLNVKVKY